MSSSLPAARPTADSDACQKILTFVLGDGDFGVNILRVQEIRGWSTVTKMPQTPPEVLGVLHLRGTVVPIIDLRLRFQLGHAEYNAMTVIIILMVQSATGLVEIGVVVDGVKGVVDVDAARLRPAPDLGAHPRTDFVSGLWSNGDHMLVLLDVDRLLGSSMAGKGSISEHLRGETRPGQNP